MNAASTQIRALTADDIPAALALWSAAEGVELTIGDSPDEVRRYLARNPNLSSAALVDGALVAAVQCGHDGRRGFIYHLAVRADFRGRGLGHAVMQRSLTLLKAEGIGRALLLVAADNDIGARFWRREGWEDMPGAKPMCLDL
ncbi:MAG: GNAT family N-acetyltransferase [Verrucomicrobia bacterium]|nr:GNAT family N-acetyltransferase [Verrucomicrobiota bacterium]